MSIFPSHLLARLGQALKRRNGTSSERVAILIDSDGISAADAQKVMLRASDFGRLLVRRAYGNFSGRSLNVWAQLMRDNGTVVRHMPSLTPGKNATDIALAIDAIELLLANKTDVFVIASSDSDFAPLARRIREDAKKVFGFGNASTPEAYRRSCDAFFAVERLGLENQPAVLDAPRWSKSPEDAEDIVLAVLGDLLDSDGEQVSLTRLGNELRRKHPGFDTRTFSRRTLRELVRDLPAVDLRELDTKLVVSPSKPPARNG